MVPRHALGTHRPELLVETGPELLQAHGPTLTRGPVLPPQPAYSGGMIPGTGSAALDVVLEIAILLALVGALVLLIKNYRGR